MLSGNLGRVQPKAADQLVDGQPKPESFESLLMIMSPARKNSTGIFLLSEGLFVVTYMLAVTFMDVT